MAATVALRSSGVTWRLVDGEVVVLDLVSSRYFSVNGPGSRLWELLDRGASPADLEDALQRAYGLEPERARTDVQTFLGKLVAFGLLTPGAAQRGSAC